MVWFPFRTQRQELVSMDGDDCSCRDPNPEPRPLPRRAVGGSGSPGSGWWPWWLWWWPWWLCPLPPPCMCSSGGSGRCCSSSLSGSCALETS